MVSKMTETELEKVMAFADLNDSSIDEQTTTSDLETALKEANDDLYLAQQAILRSPRSQRKLLKEKAALIEAKAGKLAVEMAEDRERAANIDDDAVTAESRDHIENVTIPSPEGLTQENDSNVKPAQVPVSTPSFNLSVLDIPDAASPVRFAVGEESYQSIEETAPHDDSESTTPEPTILDTLAPKEPLRCDAGDTLDAASPVRFAVGEESYQSIEETAPHDDSESTTPEPTILDTLAPKEPLRCDAGDTLDAASPLISQEAKIIARKSEPNAMPEPTRQTLSVQREHFSEEESPTVYAPLSVPSNEHPDDVVSQFELDAKIIAQAPEADTRPESARLLMAAHAAASAATSAERVLDSARKMLRMTSPKSCGSTHFVETRFSSRDNAGKRQTSLATKSHVDRSGEGDTFLADVDIDNYDSTDNIDAELDASGAAFAAYLAASGPESRAYRCA